ncbi:TM0106 family RecB-like putative nuclease [Algoriphagus aquimarinus]|uniref:Uncharacterized protein n=1 Tax=Algoriphagus aquimarinus TaxID=237018 RepID=A0A1I1CFP7_9BACT|nr:TM0106 family RecB-like putative nuclease [Algoriphagus aquimarinus]SFB59738.1 uncharacterized protein SAMN04489723_1274 [Algoriphagus aquimarinus]
MKQTKQGLLYSPSDLSNHLSCKHLTQLNKLAAEGVLEKPFNNNRVLDLLREKGISFEDQFLEELKSEDKTVIEISRDSASTEEQVIEAMHSGVDVIYQARLLEAGEWKGWADFLLKVQKQSDLGDWSYEVMDTKLASETRAGTILQIGLYSEAVAKIQGINPEYMHVKTPESSHKYRVDDYSAYIRLVKRRLKEAISNPEDTYPDPVSHCDICSWWERCNAQRRYDDHLGFVAGLGTSQTKELRIKGINTLERLAGIPLPVPFVPSKGSVETYNKLREQARVQYQSRTENRPIYELLDLVPETGFFKLPEPSHNDIYLDLEGDPMVGPSGLEYLIGWVHQGKYQPIWAENPEEEKEAFESFIDFAFTLKSKDPSVHIYHYAPYEPVAFKRLMGKYATREGEMDSLLRSGTFIDLYRVVRQSVRASVEKYSIKDLEKFYGYSREMDLRVLSGFKADYEYLLESGMPQEANEAMVQAIQLYNQDDCTSTLKLHEWLEDLRIELIEQGNEIPRPELLRGESSDAITAHQERIRPIMEALLLDISFDKDERNSEQQAKFILAHMLDWYRREKKSFWWEYFRLIELPDYELLEERGALSYLEFTGERVSVKRSVVDTYRFPNQETDIRTGSRLKAQDGSSAGSVESIDFNNRLIKIKKGPSILELHPSSVFSFEDINLTKKEEAIISLAEWVVDHGISDENQEYAAGRNLLLRVNPRIIETVPNTSDKIQFTLDWSLRLNHSYLPIQGPPGTGKSHTASHVILGLVRQGKRVGVTALSHKVISNLLNKIQEVADQNNYGISMIQKKSNDDGSDDVPWKITLDKNEILTGIEKHQVIGGTSFLWCDSELDNSVDYLFVDEAGQLSLIDTLAISGACKNLVLLGDPQQLQQPQKGVHPEGTEVSALSHVLQERQTISDDQGVFLENTWRMHPEICSFDSELFYENKLFPVTGLENQNVFVRELIEGAGLRYLEVKHEGNTNSSAEEVEAIAALVQKLLAPDSNLIDKEGKQFSLTPASIKIISPYNAQVNLLQEAIPDLEIGTVDKFQGQEAPIIIYSVATSHPQDAPRGMDFLYSLNRFNVAVSRAKAMFILVSSPAIFEPECKSPAQIKLANPFCRFSEIASEL